MTAELKDKQVAFLFTEGVEQVELIEPLQALIEAGADTTLASLQTGEVQAFNHLDKGDTLERRHGRRRRRRRRRSTGSSCPAASPTRTTLRTDPDAVASSATSSSRTSRSGVICHGPWTLIEADVVRGRTLTSWPSLQTDLRNAGAEWVDEEVHVDNGLVTSRKPDDLQAFNAKIIEEFEEGEHAGQTAAVTESLPGTAALR